MTPQDKWMYDVLYARHAQDVADFNRLRAVCIRQRERLLPLYVTCVVLFYLAFLA